MATHQNGVARRFRAARSQSVFRAINDELRVATRALDPQSFIIACECADTACVHTLEVDVEQYTQVRADPTHFIVLPGHTYPEVERVIVADARFQIVEKTGEAARVAAALAGSASNG